MKQEKFYHYVGIGNLDKDNKTTLVYYPNNNTLYVATTDVKAPNISTSVGVIITAVLYSYFKDKVITGGYPLVFSLGLGLIIGYLTIRSFLSMPVTLHQFDKSEFDLVEFLLNQKKAMKKLWNTLAFLLILTLISSFVYWFTNESVFLIGSGIGAFTLPLIYISGLHRRGRVVEKLLKEHS